MTGRSSSGASLTTLFRVLAGILVLFLTLPLIAATLRLPWGGIGRYLAAPSFREALFLSFLVSTIALFLVVLLGFPLAWILAHTKESRAGVLRTLVTLPMVLPPVVAGVVLLSAFGREGLLGPLLGLLQIQIPFHLSGAVLAATFVSAPFFVLTVEAGLRALDPGLDGAAATLGARDFRILTRITIPQLIPSLASGAALSWARALGEFGATITFAGNVRGRTQTLPLAVYEILQTDYDGAMVASFVLLAISLLVLITFRRRGGKSA